jgi:hypothetical protein
MSAVRSQVTWALVPVVASVGLSLLAAGCADDSGVGKTYPVSGKITLNHAPLNVETTTVLFKPDASRGNASPFELWWCVDTNKGTIA